MKKFLMFLAGIITIAYFSSCKKIVKNIFQGIDAEVPAFSVTLPAIPYAPPNEVFLGTLSQNFNLDSTIKANTRDVYGANDVASVKVKQLTFEISNPDEANNISNFESARITFFSDTKTDTVTVASKTFADVYASSDTYTPVSSPELKPYLNGSVLYYNVFGKLRRVTTKPLQLTIKVTLRVE